MLVDPWSGVISNICSYVPQRANIVLLSPHPGIDQLIILTALVKALYTMSYADARDTSNAQSTMYLLTFSDS